MKQLPLRPSVLLSLSALIAVAAVPVVETWCLHSTDHPDAARMRVAVSVTQQWFGLIGREKDRLGIPYPKDLEFGEMIGTEWSDMTTTLGAYDAKVTAANPDFAALVYRDLRAAGVDSGDAVGVTLSGSFPSLAIATLAAVQTIGARAVIVSSLGASMYGANQPEMTWLDMERVLRDQGELRFASAMVTKGAEADTGGGLSDEGKEILARAFERNGRAPEQFASWEEALDRRMRLLASAEVKAVVNIGGNDVMLGQCRHAEILPNGPVRTAPVCSDPRRGVIERLLERGTPVIHLLNIRDLAARAGLPLTSTRAVAGEGSAFKTRTVDRGGVLASLLLVLGPLAFLRRKATHR